jgi:hypothetical protein
MASAAEDISLHTQWQSYFDEKLRSIGRRAPSPGLNQSVNDYIRETCRDLKFACLPQNHQFYRVNWRSLPADALHGLAPQHVDECIKQFNSPHNIEPGALKEIPVIGEFGHISERRFVGGMTPRTPGWPEEQHSFVSDLVRRGRRTTLRQIQEAADRFRGQALYAR